MNYVTAFSEAVSIGLGDTMEIVGKEKAWSQMTKVSSLLKRTVVTLFTKGTSRKPTWWGRCRAQCGGCAGVQRMSLQRHPAGHVSQGSRSSGRLSVEVVAAGTGVDVTLAAPLRASIVLRAPQTLPPLVSTAALRGGYWRAHLTETQPLHSRAGLKPPNLSAFPTNSLLC